jgi:hypothetical protein
MSETRIKVLARLNPVNLFQEICSLIKFERVRVNFFYKLKNFKQDLLGLKSFSLEICLLC